MPGTQVKSGEPERCGKVWKTLRDLHCCHLPVGHIGDCECACQLPPEDHVHPSRTMIAGMYTV